MIEHLEDLEIEYLEILESESKKEKDKIDKKNY